MLLNRTVGERQLELRGGGGGACPSVIRLPFTRARRNSSPGICRYKLSNSLLCCTIDSIYMSPSCPPARLPARRANATKTWNNRAIRKVDPKVVCLRALRWHLSQRFGLQTCTGAHGNGKNGFFLKVRFFTHQKTCAQTNHTLQVGHTTVYPRLQPASQATSQRVVPERHGQARSDTGDRGDIAKMICLR